MIIKKNSSHKSKIKQILLIAVIFIIIAVSVLLILNFSIEKDGVWKPDYPKIELGSIVNKDVLVDEEYHTILMQTGLGKPAVDAIIEDMDIGKGREDLFRDYQDKFFSSGIYECSQIGLITYEEKIRNGEGELLKGFEIANLKNGDILITKATHSIGWRHGHAAIVTDASKGETLEAIVLGYNSQIQNIEKWRSYPSFMILRLKDGTDDDAVKIAEFAKDNLFDIPYGLLTGIPQKAPENIEKTQCSHLVWYPYYHFGYDIDSDGSWLVTPKDIANSNLLEIVQVFGVNPEEIWP